MALVLLLLLSSAILRQISCHALGCTNLVPSSRVKARNYFCRACKPDHEACESVAAPSTPPAPTPSLGLFGRPNECIDQLSPIERDAIVVLHKVGWLGRDIAAAVKCSENTVSLWLTRWRDTHSTADAERGGRPRCTSEEKDEEIVHCSDAHPTYTPSDIQRELRLPVSIDTIDRRLNEVGLFGRVQETEHALDEFDIQRRLAFANQYLHWSEDQWARVFFSDETHFYLGHHGRTYVRRPVGASHDPKYMRQEEQRHGKVSLWGCICAEGLGHAELYAGSLDSTRHRDMLRHSLIPTFKQFYPAGPWYFQQDNVRFHTTPNTLTYLHEKGITLFEWPPWSPDLNPIENLWNELKARVYARFPQTMEEMEQLIREEWEATDLNFVSHICRSMPRRLQLLLDNNGHKISY